MVRLFLICSLTALSFNSFAALQLFPAKKDNGKVSAFLVKPSSGFEREPAGWAKVTHLSYGNCALAGEVYTPKNKGGGKVEMITTTSYVLPRSKYLVSVCVRGKGKARIKGTEEWIDFHSKPANAYRWIEIGSTADVDKVAVEVAFSGDRSFYYAGLLLEGDKLNINPVSKVWERIQKGERVVVALLGDSVTENFGGKGGGASGFEKGNPGLLKAFLEKASGQEVDYIAHRQPKQRKITTIDGKKYPDQRQELDESKRIHLVNLATGGADSSYSWSRIPYTVRDYSYKGKRALIAKGIEPEVLRHGLEFYKPDLVFINFGINDNNGAHTKWTVDDYIFYTKVVATCIQQKLDAAVILSTPHKWNDSVHLANHWEPLLVDTLRAYCKKSGFTLADVIIRYKIGQGDKIHPRDAGHAAILAAYTRALKGEPQVPESKPTLTGADFRDNGDGTVTIAKNKLMMLKAPNTLGKVKSHKEALEVVNKMNAEKKFGHVDWRLPKRSEVFPLFDQSLRPAVIKDAPFTELLGFYYVDKEEKRWGKGFQHWGVDFTIGIAHMLGSKGDPKVGHVFPVRDVE